MTVHPIVVKGEPVLHRRAKEVETFDDELRTLVADLHETNQVANGAGLAAPQIGIGLRVFVYAMENEDGVAPQGVLVNPSLTIGKVSGNAPDPDDEAEGCLSVPGEHFPLKRAEWAKISGFDEFGQAIQFEATGWFARCMQHEYDHLDGKLYLDRLVDRYQRKARRVAKDHGWGVPGISWMPGVDPDPFGH